MEFDKNTDKDPSECSINKALRNLESILGWCVLGPELLALVGIASYGIYNTGKIAFYASKNAVDKLPEVMDSAYKFCSNLPDFSEIIDYLI